MIDTVNCVKTVSITVVNVITLLSSGRLDVLLLNISLGLTSGPSASSTEKVQAVHPALRVLIVEVIVVPNHFAVGVPEPSHNHSLRDSCVGPANFARRSLSELVVSRVERGERIRETHLLMS